VNAGRKVEISHQTILEKHYIFNPKSLRIEIATSTITSATAIVHIPDCDSEWRFHPVDDSFRNTLDFVLSIKQLEVLIEYTGCAGDESVMNVCSIRSSIKELDTLWNRRIQLSKLIEFPFDQSALLMTVIDSQSNIPSIAFKASVAKNRSQDDISATKGQTHKLLDFPRYYPLARCKLGLHRYKPNLLERLLAQGPKIEPTSHAFPSFPMA
jgi:hypothetical protein